MTPQFGVRMDWLERFSSALTTKSLATTSALSAAGGVAAEQAPRLSEAVLFHAGGYGVTLPALSLLVAIAAGMLSIFKPLIAACLRGRSR